MQKTVFLDADQLPTLVFGALTHLKYAACLVLRMPTDAAEQCQAWLDRMVPLLSYGYAPKDRPARVLSLAVGGLRRLGLDAADLATFPAAFVNGMTAAPRSRALGDTGSRAPKYWQWGSDRERADAALIVYAPTSDALRTAITEIGLIADSHDVTIGECIQLQVRARGDFREPFGFRDGVSQPIIPGTPAARHAASEDQIVAAGEFVLGYLDSRGYMPPVPTVAAAHDPDGLLPLLPGGRRDLGRNSSFLVVRQLYQDVKAFNDWVAARAGESGMCRDLVAAKLLGRWPNGSSLVRHLNNAGQHADNDFGFKNEDPDGLACPLGSHIRRANPRDSLNPDSPDPLRITNRHRILRVGRPYVEAPGEPPSGLLFMCLNADIERQFEFIQQSWLLGRSFDGLRDEADPFIGRNGGVGSFTVPSAHGPLHLCALPDFVTPVGGGYFWLPSRSAVAYLSRNLVRDSGRMANAHDRPHG